MLMPVSWSRMPNHFLQVETRRGGQRSAGQCRARSRSPHDETASPGRTGQEPSSEAPRGWGRASALWGLDPTGYPPHYLWGSR